MRTGADGTPLTEWRVYPSWMQDEEKDVSRRDFFKTVGVGSIATAVVAGVKDTAAQGPAAIGPDEVPVTLTINGQRHQLRVEPRVTLLDAMRTRLDITGQKRVCDRGACGACTVIIEGRDLLLVLDAGHRSAGTSTSARLMGWPEAMRFIPSSRHFATPTA